MLLSYYKNAILVNRYWLVWLLMTQSRHKRSVYIMKYLISKEDLQFKNQIESCEFPVPDFDHRAHVRLAYVYPIGDDTDIASL